MSFYRHPLIISALALLLATNLQAIASSDELAEVLYQASNAILTNPERGFYIQKNVQAEGKPLTSKFLSNLRARNITLVLRMYYLKPFRNRPLSPAQLKLIQQDFSTLRKSGCKCILRFAYSSWIGDIDAPQKTVMQHIDQLEPLVRENIDVIATFQTGFIGPWGEMHNSTNGLDRPEPTRKIVQRLLKMLPTTRCVQVRTPNHKQQIVNSDHPLSARNAFSVAAAARIGHYNDCFLANETDVGTYAEQKIQQQKKYLAQDTRYVPMGGETCRLSPFIEIANARQELSQMHWTFLHLEYHPNVIEAWRRNKFLDEIQRKLGYRLTLVRSSCSSNAKRNGSLTFSMQLSNNGWAAPINPREVIVIAKHEQLGTNYHAKLPADPRTWLPDQPIEIQTSLGIPGDMPPGKYQLLLSLPDPETKLKNRPQFAIKLANQGLWNDATGHHSLKQTLVVSAEIAAPQEQPAVWFKPSPQ